MEILNIDYHISRKVLTALNKYKDEAKAAVALGCTINELSNYRKKFNIYRCPVKKDYSFAEPKKVV